MKQTWRVSITTSHSHHCEPDLHGTVISSEPEQLDGLVDENPLACQHHPNCEVFDRYLLDAEN